MFLRYLANNVQKEGKFDFFNDSEISHKLLM
jgi:hypothetical protein